MQTLDLHVLDRSRENSGIQIEAAPECDGSLCHQPIFREDGTLNHVPPHSHLIERDSSGVHCYAILCDFPEEKISRATVRPHVYYSKSKAW